MPEPSIPLMFPQLGGLYQAIAPLAEALLRMCVGLALVPHGLRMTFGFFPNTGQPLRTVRMLADYLDRQGYRPGKVLALAISMTQLVCGPLVALGLFTRLAAVPVVLFLLVTNIERWRVGKYFWNQLGLEYTLMWTVAALYFLVHGGGAYALDRLITDAAQLQHWSASY
jgi:putative oxidoreductase